MHERAWVVATLLLGTTCKHRELTVLRRDFGHNKASARPARQTTGVHSHSVLYARQEGLPDWLAVLQHELGGDEFDGRDDLLMLSAVLDEFDTVVAGALLGHGTLLPVHWQSLLGELEHTR